MTKSAPDPSAPRMNTRVPLETKVNLEFEKFSGFVSEYSSNISVGGIFIKTKEPKPVGTVFSFEFKLADNFKLIQGIGEVTWVRTLDVSAEKPAGMGARFHEIDAPSRELIETMVSQYVSRGGTPFRLEDGLMETAALPPPDAPSGISAGDEDFKALFAAGEATSELSATTEPIPSLLTNSSPAILIDDTAPEPVVIPKKPISKTIPTKMVNEPSAAKKSSAWIWIFLFLVLAGLGSGGYFYREKILRLISPPMPQPAPVAKAVAPPSKAAPRIVATAAFPTPMISATAASPSLAPATALENVTWKVEGNQTVLTLWWDGALTKDRYSDLRVEGKPPKEVIKILGIKRPYPKTAIEIGTPHLIRIRNGYHLTLGGGELHVVLDLKGASNKIASIEPDGARLRISISK